MPETSIKPLGDGFDEPTVVTDLDIAFPAEALSRMPARTNIPDEFNNPSNDWVKFVSHWFGYGNPFAKWNVGTPDPHIDGDLAIRHIQSIMGSFEPQHQHKIAACAWLMSRWFNGIEIIT